MLTHFRRAVSLSIVSSDMPIWTTVETVATVYQHTHDRYHLMLTEPEVCEPYLAKPEELRLIWMEISPDRVAMTMQGNGKLSYRHCWERNAYGTSRYWLQRATIAQSNQFQLRNFTHQLELIGTMFPRRLHLDYELWSSHTRMGRYMMDLEIGH